MINQELKTKNAFKMRAQIYNILMGTKTRSIFALKVSLFILTFFHASLIFSDLQSTNYEAWITSVTSKPISQVGNGILKVGSTINTIISSLGLYSISRLISSQTIVLILCFLAVVVCLNIFAIWNADKVAWVALQKPTRRGKLFLKPLFKSMMQFTFKYYDLIFPICLILSTGSLSCRWVEVEASYGANDSVLSRTIFESSFIAAQVFEIRDETVPIHVNFLHDDVLCLSNNDIMMKIFGALLLVSSLFLRIVFSKLRRFSRNPLCYDSSLDGTDLFQEIIINFFLAWFHILQVVLPSNRTQAQVDQIREDYNSVGERRIIQAEGESKTHIFSGWFLKQDYTVTIYLLVFTWVVVFVMKRLLIKNQPWLNRLYRNSKISQITIVQLLLEFKIILEFFNSYGIMNFYLGELNSNNLSKEPSLPVYFLDRLGYSKGGRGFIFLLVISVLKVKSTLNSLESSWGYLKNLKNSMQTHVDDEGLANVNEIRKQDVLEKKDLITIYFLTLKYIDYEIQIRKGTVGNKDQDTLEIEMCLLGINKNHIETCRNAQCYCKIEEKILKGGKYSELLKRGDPMDTFDHKFSYLRGAESIKMALEYLEQQFQNYIQFHGKTDDEVIYPFIKFLLLYTGKISKAVTLFYQKKRIVQAESKSVDTNTDIEDISIILQKVIEKNQEDGSMYLLITGDLLSSELPANTYLRPKNVILFLDSLQTLKALCRQISDLKFKILTSLVSSENSGMNNKTLKEQTPTMMKLSIKKHLLFKVCSRLRKTQYWNYMPLLILLSWLFGSILEDEWGWGNIMRQVNFQFYFTILTFRYSRHNSKDSTLWRQEHSSRSSRRNLENLEKIGNLREIMTLSLFMQTQSRVKSTKKLIQSQKNRNLLLETKIR